MHNKTKFFICYMVAPLGGLFTLYSALSHPDHLNQRSQVKDQPQIPSAESKPDVEGEIVKTTPLHQECFPREFIAFASEGYDSKTLFSQTTFTLLQDFDYVEASRIKACVHDLEALVKDEKVEFFVSHGGSNERERNFPRFLYVRDDDSDPNPALEGYWAHTSTHAEVPAQKGLTGTAIKIGVLDSGVNPNVPQFQKQIKEFRDFVYGKKENYDDKSHGTFVIGIITKVVPAADVFVYKIHDREGFNYMTDVLEGLDQVIAADLDLINNSWGLSEARELEGMTWADGNLVLAEALERVAKNGTIIVASAGNGSFYGSFDDYKNSSASLQLPDGSPYVISVGATDVSGEIADFSDLDAHIFAPGDLVYSTINAKEHQLWSGTSFSAPFVTAAVAVIQDYAKKNDYSFSQDEILKILERSAADQSSTLVFSSGKELQHYFKALDYGDLVMYLEKNYRLEE